MYKELGKNFRISQKYFNCNKKLNIFKILSTFDLVFLFFYLIINIFYCKIIDITLILIY